MVCEPVFDSSVMGYESSVIGMSQILFAWIPPRPNSSSETPLEGESMGVELKSWTQPSLSYKEKIKKKIPNHHGFIIPHLRI